MRVSIGVLSVILACDSIINITSAVDPPVKERPTLLIPDGAAIRLVPFRNRWYLGENILLHYEVQNNGRAPFSVNSGSDYRGGTRANRFVVVATSEDGTVQTDPAPFQMMTGGIGGSREVEPGGSWFGTVPLIRYRRLFGPGRYTIRVAHDLGWLGQNAIHGMSKAKDLPDQLWAEATIDVVMPDAAEARQVLTEMQAMRDTGAVWGDKRGLYPDYGALCYPVYVPHLLELARSHHPEAVQGLANLFEPVGTSALIELLSVSDDPQVRTRNFQQLRRRQDISMRQNESVADTAARALNQRLPLSEKMKDSENFQGRKERAEKAWRPEHTAQVRVYATNVLLHQKPRGLRDARLESAAQLLRCIGTDEDAAAVLTAMENALQLSQTERMESPLTYGLIHNLRACASGMKIAIEQPNTPAEIAIYLQTLNREGTDRPDLFHEEGPAWLRHPIHFVQRLTLEALPKPTPEWALEELASLAASSDVGVRYLAAQRIGESANRRFHKTLLERMAVETDQWVIGDLHKATSAVGIPRAQTLRTWAKRLGRKIYDAKTQKFNAGIHIFRIIQDDVIEHSGGSGANGNRSRTEPKLVSRWLAFIDANEAELNAGRKFKIGDPELTEGLMPAGMHLYVEGKQWPETPEQ